MHQRHATPVANPITIAIAIANAIANTNTNTIAIPNASAFSADCEQHAAIELELVAFVASTGVGRNAVLVLLLRR